MNSPDIDESTDCSDLPAQNCFASSERDPAWLAKLRSAVMLDCYLETSYRVRKLDVATLGPNILWAIELPSLKRIQVIKGRLNEKLLELRQYTRDVDGCMFSSKNKFIRLTKEQVITLIDNYDEIVAAIKEINQGHDVSFSINLSPQMTVEIVKPYRNINLRTWYSPSSGTRRPGWGIVLSLEEFETLWKWADDWNPHLIGIPQVKDLTPEQNEMLQEAWTQDDFYETSQPKYSFV